MPGLFLRKMVAKEQRRKTRRLDEVVRQTWTGACPLFS